MKRLRTIVMTIMLLLPLLPLPAYGQSDGFFAEEDEFFRFGDDSSLGGIWGNAKPTDYETGEELPLGDGILVLAMAACIYLIVRKKNAHKTAAAAACAFALTLGMTQCRKTVSDIPAPAGETISISLNGGSNGDRANINVDNGQITWKAGDRVFVVCNNLVASSTGTTAQPILLGGNLEAKSGDEASSTIGGTVTVPDNYTLPGNPVFVFYYVGKGVGFSNTMGATSLTFDIANQYDKTYNSTAVGNDVPGEYMIGRSDTVNMVLKGSTYQPKYHPEMARTFLPLTAVLRLNVGSFGSGEIRLHAVSKVYNTMTIDLSGSATPSYTKGDITFRVGNDAKISVLPAAKGENDTLNLNFSCSEAWGRVGIKNGIEAGRIYVKLLNNTSYPIPVPQNATATGEADPFNGCNWNGDDPSSGNGTTENFGNETWP